MEKLLRDAARTLGCDDKEIRLFLACYLRGEAPLSELIKAARLQRSTAYLIAKSLVDKGLIIEDHKTYGKLFRAVEPQELMRMVATKQRQVGRQRLALEEHLGELQAAYHTNEIRPRVRTYQGVSGLISVWHDVLTAQGEILIWTNQVAESKLFSSVQHDQFIRERREGGHHARVLTVNNAAGQSLRAGDTDNLRETRLLPAGIDFSAETYIYDNKVAVFDYNRDIIAIITESQHVAEAHRAMFESAWQAAQSS